ncbi:MAG: cell division protein FtsQ/DivIB [Endozoicomonadaceae bacterium]|nr:cell division protein FtsQ/DivIB [Endozoicomonadaceae bacterium]
MGARIYASDGYGHDRLKKRSSGRADKKSYGASRPKDRRIAIRRWVERGARVVKLLAAGVVTGIFFWSLPWLWSWIDRPITRVMVESEFLYLARETVQQQVTPFLTERFFYLDVAGLQKALQNVPWINRAKIRKVWPNMLLLRIHEQVPVARWNSGVLNGDGDVFQVEDMSPFSDLPLLYGRASAAQQVMQQYVVLNQQVRSLGLGIGSLGQRDTGSWWFLIDDVEINLGHRDLVRRMQRFMRLYHVLLQNRWKDVRGVDLRYRDGVAVSWKTHESRKISRSN